MASQQSFRDLIRSTEGQLDHRNYLRGIIGLSFMTIMVTGALFGVARLRESMDWMTVAVAPLVGVVVLFAVCSLIYFWFCIFIKRLRALNSSPVPIYGWLLALLAAGIFKLLDYQNETLGLANDGWLTYTNLLSLSAALIALALFLYVLWQGLASRR